MNKLFSVLIMTLMLTACSKGVDVKLTTGEGPEAYRASYEKAAKDMSADDIQAYNWAVENITIESLHQTFPNNTPRDIIRAAANYYHQLATEKIIALEKNKPHYDALQKQLAGIQAEDVRFIMDRNFHGLQPTITAKIVNNSDLPVSRMRFQAQLFINDQTTPVANYEIAANFNNAHTGTSFFSSKQIAPGGLDPHHQINKRFTIGFVTGDIEWTTLEIQKAAKHHVTLTPLLYSIEDYANKSYMQGAPYQELEHYTTLLKQSEQYQNY
jgi:hypothetical protein